jgi:hypothetical protein
MRRTAAVLALLAVASATACGDGERVAGPGIPGEDVAGQYTTALFTFDVQGTLPEKDLLATLDSTRIPRLLVAASGDAQLVYYQPNGLLEIFGATFVTLTDGIRLRFNDAAALKGLPLPRTLDLILEDGNLVYADNVTIARQRLVELVPEFADEPLAENVPGFLRVVFQRLVAAGG